MNPSRAAGRGGRFEAVEPRLLFSASPVQTLGDLDFGAASPPAVLVAVGTQPDGGLSDKIVYLNGGHGYTADNLGSGAWSTQRGEGFEIVEDLGNQDQMTLLADYLFNAGATVVPLRPVGHQLNEVVLDNDDPQVTFTGSWSNSSAGVYFGDAGDVPYRFAGTSAAETATAEYRPDLPDAGHYPVYAWTRAGSDRAGDQLYRVNHAGGSTDVRIDHRRVGNGAIYLGTYYFEQGTAGSVEISNQSSESGRVVIADMIRFGNGMGDIDRGGGVSGHSREDEAGLYWIKWHVDHSQGVPDSKYRASSDDGSATVSATPRYAEYMNREADGALSDRVFVSFHSNAGGGRGAIGLHNTSSGGATPNQLLLARTLAKQVNDDLVAQSAGFEHAWLDRGSNLTFQASFNYGEINNAYAQNEFDATIVETGFHDNQLDAELLRDPRVRDAIARATYQGIVDYFNDVDNGATALTTLPAPVSDLQAVSETPGQVTVRWTPPPANAAVGDAATGYVVYQSTDGYGFDGGTPVLGGSTDRLTLINLDPADGVRYFKVAAVNAGGQSLSPHTVAALPTDTDQRVLIVNGFDRLGRAQDPTQPWPAPSSSNTVDRVRPRSSNSFDYAVQHAAAIGAFGNGLVGIDTAQNEAVAAGQIDLSVYDAVFWISGEESTADRTFTPPEQSAVLGYLGGGGHFFVSGAEIGWDLDQFNNGRSFYNNQLHADYVADDAGTYAAAGVAGSIFQGISLGFDTADTVYDAEFPDVIAPRAGAVAALTYVGGTGGAAAVQFDAAASGGAGGNVVTLGFPFETIAEATDRDAVMAATLVFFGLTDTPAAPATIEGRFTFYNGSFFDGNSAAANADDDNAIATDKQALLPGQTATFANITSYHRGVNGVALDIRDLASASLQADDFAFAIGSGDDPAGFVAAGITPVIDVRPGSGADGSDRVSLVLPDGTARNQWLRVTVRANADTGLTEDDTFYFGNLPGETGNAAGTPRVSTSDIRRTAFNSGRTAEVDNPVDHNRSGRVTSTDIRLAAAGSGASLTLLAAPLPALNGSLDQALVLRAAASYVQWQQILSDDDADAERKAVR